MFAILGMNLMANKLHYCSNEKTNEILDRVNFQQVKLLNLLNINN